VATASSDCSACIWDVSSGDLISAMIEHTGEVTKVPIQLIWKKLNLI